MKNILFLLAFFSLSVNAYTVGDRVWNDSNQNWEQDVGEEGIANVTVELFTDKGQKVQSTLSDTQGKYNFENVELGDYVIKVTPPQGVTLITSNNLEKWVEKDRLDADFGLYIPSINNGYSVTGKVWNDTNQNWEQDADEEGIVNVMVELLTDKGQKVESTTTDTQGQYAFTNIEIGDYVIKVIPSNGMELITSNNLQKWVDKDKKGVDFGLYIPNENSGYTIGDRVWNDINQNWNQDAGEEGVANVTIELLTDKGKKLKSTTTDAQGKYAFTNIEIGDYIIKLIPSDGMELITSNNLEKWVEKDRLDVDFGVYKGANNGDVTAPVIVLNGDSTVRLKIGTDYVEEGATATDNIDGDISNNIQIDPNVDTSKEGNYTVRYSVSDAAGNSATKTRKVIVSKKIVKPPVPSSAITINEVLVSNASTNLDPDFKEYSGWVELYNHTDKRIDLKGYALSDDPDRPLKWEMPNGAKIDAGEYLLIWMDKEYDIANAIHASFKMSYKGEALTLYDSDEKLIDSITFPKQKGDISCAKVDNKIVYMVPTPNMPNGKTYTTSKRASDPSISLKSGFYNGTQRVKLSQKNGGDIYYTTDGSIPTKSSTKYSSAFSINKTTVVRAIAFENGKFKSEVSNSTYLINENITLPVVSIAINDEYLNDNDIGMYKNYTERWMRTGSIEYIKDGTSKFSENVGIRIFGGQTRAYAQKSLAIFAKARFGAKSIKYKLFPDKNIKKVKSFVLRNSGNDWGYTMMKDGLVHNIVKDTMDIDYQSYQPTVVFINGKYWGIHNIREKTNEDYIEANHGVDSKNIDLLEGDEYEANEGSNDAYLELLEYIKNNSLEKNSNYNYVKSKIDIDEYINYMITETYVGNIDWLYNNIKYWREQSDTSKWRWILYDTDDSFDDINFDSMAFVLEENGPAEPNPPHATFLFRSLMQNVEFKEKFIGTFISHLNTTFRPLRIDSIITDMKNTIKPEIQRHFDKWGRVSPKDWENGSSGSIRALREFALDRAEVMRGLLSTHFNLKGNKNLSITVSNNGSITLDGIKLKSNYRGNYFNGSSVTLKAEAKQGFTFIKWSNGSTDKEIKVKLDSDISITAEFQ